MSMMGGDLERVDWEYISHQELDLMIRMAEFPYMNTPMRSLGNLTPLCMACKLNREDLVTVLLWHGAKTYLENSPKGRQPLHYACDLKEGNIGLVRKLLQAGADINAQDIFSYTGLHAACSKNNLPVVELLCQSGANVNLVSVDETPLIIACLRDRIDIITILLNYGGDPNSCDGQALEMAILNKSFSSLEVLVKAGICLQQSRYLSQACESNSLKMMKALIHHGVDVNRHDKAGMAPLHTACVNCKTDVHCVRLLLHHGAHVNPISSRCTPLYYAAIHRNIHKVRVLLAYGADVNGLGAFVLCAMIKQSDDHNRLYISKKYVLVFRLLVAAGLRLTLGNLDDLKEKISYTEKNKSKTQLEELIEDHGKEPLSLQSMCRIAIRSNIRPVVDKNLKALPLPGHVIHYLNFSDIADESLYENSQA